jgi:hypothetical protein
MAKAGLVTSDLGVVVVFGIRLRRAFEGMRRGAQADDRSAAIQVGIEVLHLLRRQALEAEEHDREVRGVQRLHARNVLRLTAAMLPSGSMSNSTVHLKP